MISFDNPIVAADIDQIVGSLEFAPLNGSTVLVTGATGMLATYVVYTLAQLKLSGKADVEVIALGRNRAKMAERFGSLIEQGAVKPLYQDICEPLAFQGKVNYIIHLAGAANPATITTDPVGIIRANTTGLFSVMELARAKGARVLFASTREVYGAVAEGVTILNEETIGAIDPIDSRSCYPESKRMAETICKSYNIQHGVPSTILRIAHCYGPGMNLEGDGRVMSDLMADVIASRNITLKSTGEAIRAFCYISDAVEGLFRALLSPSVFELYNLANEREPITVLALAKLLCATLPERGLTVTHREPTAQERAGYAKFERVTLDTSKMESIGWSPRVTLTQGVQRTIKSFTE
ncbi:MAG: NAD-dependent epimerase/dehydratase family protein [Rikenellaceae bacterium]